VIAKPFPPEVLLRVVSRLLQSQDPSRNAPSDPGPA
jgi:hypothetical protein